MKHIDIKAMRTRAENLLSETSSSDHLIAVLRKIPFLGLHITSNGYDENKLLVQQVHIIGGCRLSCCKAPNLISASPEYCPALIGFTSPENSSSFSELERKRKAWILSSLKGMCNMKKQSSGEQHLIPQLPSDVISNIIHGGVDPAELSRMRTEFQKQLSEGLMSAVLAALVAVSLPILYAARTSHGLIGLEFSDGALKASSFNTTKNSLCISW
ncbi:hypothetical protein AKJ16_DCAP15096 [Drosera capensis]